MVDYKTIQDYNQYLINNQLFLNIIDYVKEINIIYNIDINFINDFIELVSEDKCCIHYNMLQKYEVVPLLKGTTYIKNLINKYQFIENEDYQLRNVSEFKSQGSTSIKNEYYLHPIAFKICLIRTLKTKQYAKYYILLEKCIKYFNDYQLELNKKYNIKLKLKIEKKDNKINKLKEKLNIIIILNDELSKKQNFVIEELNNYKNNYKLLTKVIKKLENYITLLTNKITDIENNNKILTDIIDDCNKN